MTDLKALVRRAGDLAQTQLIERGEPNFAGMFHLVAPGGRPDVVMICPWRDDQEKPIALAEVKKISHRMGAVAAMFAGEVWLVKRDAGHLWESEDPPSQQPDRIEAVFAVATDGKATVASTWNIVRSRPGGPVLALVEQPEMAGHFEGRLLDGLIRR